jgi:hypothetical protein
MWDGPAMMALGGVILIFMKADEVKRTGRFGEGVRRRRRPVQAGEEGLVWVGVGVGPMHPHAVLTSLCRSGWFMFCKMDKLTDKYSKL